MKKLLEHLTVPHYHKLQVGKLNKETNSRNVKYFNNSSLNVCMTSLRPCLESGAQKCLVSKDSIHFDDLKLYTGLHLEIYLQSGEGGNGFMKN